MRSASRALFFGVAISAAASVAAAAALGACAAFDAASANAEGKSLPDADATSSDAASADAPTNERDGAASDAGAGADDAGPSTIIIPIVRDGGWSSPNTAVANVTSAGVSISSYGLPAHDHPILVPSPSPPIPSDDFTVRATFFTSTPAEFGVVTRLQSDSSGALLGSEFGGTTTPFIGPFSSSDYNPQNQLDLLPYPFKAGKYAVAIRAVGDALYGKFWSLADAEPTDWSDKVTIPYATGRGIGFYTYGEDPNVVLESLIVTVP